MSPTSPTFVALNDRLNKAHHRIRELEVGEAKLLAQIRILCAVITDLTHEVHARSAVELTSSPLPTALPDDGSDDRSGIGDQVGKQKTQRASPPAAHSQEPPVALRRPPRLAQVRSKRERGDPMLLDEVDSVRIVFILIAVVWLVASVIYGRDDR